MAAAMVNQMIQLKYSRGDESESDGYGLKLMAQAGYDPSAHARRDAGPEGGEPGATASPSSSPPTPCPRPASRRS